jgi:hypothetical protein
MSWNDINTLLFKLKLHLQGSYQILWQEIFDATNLIFPHQALQRASSEHAHRHLCQRRMFLNGQLHPYSMQETEMNDHQAGLLSFLSFDDDYTALT